MPETRPRPGRRGAELAALFERFVRERGGGSGGLPLRPWLELAESWRIEQALAATRGNRSAAARMLGIGRRTLYTKIAKLGLVPAWRVSNPGANGSYASEATRSTRGEVG